MNLYLVRHAEAKSALQDPEMPLTDRGLEDIEKVADFVARLGLKLCCIFHSDKLRAVETARVLADRLKPSKGAFESEGLRPMDDPGVIARRIREKDMMLVGHLPHLGRLAALLLTGDKERSVVSFSNACIVNLRKDDGGTWTVGWMLTPEVIR
jgi:phosphohistidine phosphatase